MLCCRASEFIGCVFLGGHAAVDSGTVEDHWTNKVVGLLSDLEGVGFLSNGWTKFRESECNFRESVVLHS